MIFKPGVVITGLGVSVKVSLGVIESGEFFVAVLVVSFQVSFVVCFIGFVIVFQQGKMVCKTTGFPSISLQS